jgi:hypothetical protein
MNVNIITAFSLIAISIGAIQKITYLMVYLYVYGIPFDRLRAYFTKTTDDAEEQEELRRILQEEEEVVEEPVASANEVVEAEVANEAVVASSSVADEKDTTLWYPIEDKKGRYKGEWRNGMPNGEGIKHIYKDDTYIYGNFVNGNAEGHCKQTFEQTWEKSQPYYEGNFKRNEYHGKGEYHYGDGNYYKGDWKDSKYHGHGADYSKRLNKTWVGEFCNDEKVEGNYVKGEI